MGLRRVCQCCSDSVAVDRTDLRSIPPLDHKRSPAEVEDSQFSDQQLLALRAFYLAKQFAFDPVFQFDPLTDSMKLLTEDLGIESTTVDELTQMTVDGQGVLTEQAGNNLHTVYNVTATGRKLIAEPHQDGVDFGPGIGDLNESALHRIGVLYLCLYLEQQYARSPDRTVQHYYELPSNEVVDAVVLEDGDIVVAAEMECHNNDVDGADSSSCSTYRKLMDLDVEEALWIFETRDHWTAGNEALAKAHQEPQSPIEFRQSAYHPSTISKGFAGDYPGMTDALLLKNLVDQVEYPPSLFNRSLSRFRGE